MDVSAAINKGREKTKEAKSKKLKTRLSKDDLGVTDFLSLVDFYCSELEISYHYRNTVKNGQMVKHFLVRRDYHIQGYSENPQDFIRLAVKHWRDFCTDKHNFWGAVFFYFDLEKIITSPRAFFAFKEFLFYQLVHDEEQEIAHNSVYKSGDFIIEIL